MKRQISGTMRKCLQKSAAHWVGVCFLLVSFAGCEPDLKTVEKTTDQAKLAKIAMNAEYPGVREAAVEKLADQSLLAKVVWENSDESPRIRLLAVKKLTDQAVLAKIAMKTEEWNVCLAAVEKISDQAVLTKIAEEDPGMKIRKAAAVKKERAEQARLKKASERMLVAFCDGNMEGEDSGVRLAAVKKLTDQAALAKLAMEDKEWCVRCTAIETLADQALLAKVAVETKYPDARRTAYYKLSEAGNLAEFSTNTKNPTTRLYVSIFLKIHTVLQSIPEKNEFPKRHRAELEETVLDLVHILANPGLTTELGNIEDIQIKWEPLSAEYEKIGTVQGESFTISAKLSKLEQSITLTWLTQFPLRAGKTKWILPEISAGDFFEKICGFLSDPTLVLFALEPGESDGFPRDANVCTIAVKKLLDQSMLAKVAVEAKDGYVRHTALEKLTDPAVLSTVAVQEEAGDVREAARNRLTKVLERKLDEQPQKEKAQTK